MLLFLVLRIRNKLREANDQSLPLPDVVCEQLEKHVTTIVQALPDDLRTVLHNGSGSIAGNAPVACAVEKILSPKIRGIQSQDLNSDESSGKLI